MPLRLESSVGLYFFRGRVGEGGKTIKEKIFKLKKLTKNNRLERILANIKAHKKTCRKAFDGEEELIRAPAL